MDSEHQRGASDIEKALLAELTPQEANMVSEIVRFYSIGKSVSQTSQELKDSEDYVRHVYFVLYKISLRKGIKVPDLFSS
jgi:hypothetical protein